MAKPAAELYWLPKDTKKMDRWAGVVSCQRLRYPENWEENLALWGDCGLRMGHFLFFGDPALLARIRTILGDTGGRRGEDGLEPEFQPGATADSGR
jgi:hypothetical protein